jgi:hypothetical protein
VAETSGLLNRRTLLRCTEGSNPSLSAEILRKMQLFGVLLPDKNIGAGSPIKAFELIYMFENSYKVKIVRGVAQPG